MAFLAPNKFAKMGGLGLGGMAIAGKKKDDPKPQGWTMNNQAGRPSLINQRDRGMMY